MFRSRIIPVLLLRGLGIVKSSGFKNYRYIGDPINAVKIFNDKKADELVFMDIQASKEKRCISLDFIRKIGDESNMPFSVGGGIRTIENIRKLLQAGAEKVVLNTIAYENPMFVKEAVDSFGSSTIVVCMDIKKSFWGKEQTWVYSGTKSTGIDPLSFAGKMEEMGAGEIIVQSIERDGSMEGYDIPLIKEIANSVSVPVVALGGAGDYSDLKKAIRDGNASAAAAGSLFVFHGPRKAVLISFPNMRN